jgi:hypothetical protein
MCTNTLTFLPWSLYCAGYLYAGYRASKERIGRAPGILWQFKRETYNEAGWTWHKRSRWLLAGAIPFVLLVALLAKITCSD